MTKRKLETISVRGNSTKPKVNLDVGVVQPKDVSYKTLPFFALFSGKIKVDYSCGNCRVTQTTKISSRDEYSIIPCEYCLARNMFATPHVESYI